MIQHDKWLTSLLLLILAVVAQGQTGKVDTRTGHTADVNAIAFSPDGKLLASGSDDGTIKFWNAATGKEERTIDTADEVKLLAFSPDGKMLLSGWSLSLWDTQTGKKIRGFDYTSCDSAAFSADSKLTLCGQGEGVKIFYTDTGEEALAISAAKAPALFIAKDKKIISASGGGLIRIWDAGTGKRLQTIEDVGELEQIAVSADGRFMACLNSSSEAKDEDRVQLFNLFTGRRIPFPQSKAKKPDEDGLETAADAPGSLAFSSTGNVLAIGYSSFKGSNIKLINSLTGTTIGEIKEGDNSNKPGGDQSIYGNEDITAKLMVFSPDGATIASIGVNDKAIHLWNATTRKLKQHLQGHSINVDAIAFSQDSKRLLSISDEGTLLWWNVGTQKLEKLFSIPIDRYLGFDLSPDAKVITYRARNESKNVTELQFYDTEAGKNSRSFPISLLGPTALSPDKKMIAGSSSDFIKILDTNTGDEIRTIIWAKSGGIILTQIVFNSSGQMLAGRSNSWLKIWDVATGKEIDSFDLDSLDGSIAFNPQKDILAFTVTSKDYSSITAKLVDLRTGKEIGSYPTTLSNGEIFTFDGNFVAVGGKGDDSIIFFDIASNKEVKRISLVKDDKQNPSSTFPSLPLMTSIGVYAVNKKLSFSPDGKYLAIATTKGVRLFDLRTGQELSPLV